LEIDPIHVALKGIEI